MDNALSNNPFAGRNQGFDDTRHGVRTWNNFKELHIPWRIKKMRYGKVPAECLASSLAQGLCRYPRCVGSYKGAGL